MHVAPPSRSLRACPSGGFTLVELLVVIAIIGVLVALLLPAVQQAREASRRAKCLNNLKQMGVAIHNYHDSFKCFPPGGITLGCCCNTKSYTSWTISILPFLESNNLAERYIPEVFNEDNPNRFVREQYVGIYTCPSEREPRRLLSPDSGPGANVKYMTGNYRGMEGRSDGTGWWDNQQNRTSCPGSPDWLNDPMKSTWKGIFHNVDNLLKPEAMHTIRDGTSNTLMVGENVTRTHDNRGTFWAYSYASYNKSAALPQSRTLIGDYDRCVAIGGAGGENACKRGWGSYHPGVLQFALADGSVRPLRINMDMNIFCEMATVAGGEAPRE